MSKKQNMNKEKLREKLKPILIDTIEEFQELCGDDQGEEKPVISESTIPISDFKEFSSLRGVGVTKFFFQKLNLNPDKVPVITIFSTKDNMPRSISEILNYLCESDFLYETIDI
jgi:hypothetical protein